MTARRRRTAKQRRTLAEMLASDDPVEQREGAEAVRTCARAMGHGPEETEREIARRIREAELARAKGGER